MRTMVITMMKMIRKSVMGKNLVHMCQNYVNKYEKANATENLTHKFSDHWRGKLVPSSIS